MLAPTPMPIAASWVQAPFIESKASTQSASGSPASWNHLAPGASAGFTDQALARKHLLHRHRFFHRKTARLENR